MFLFPENQRGGTQVDEKTIPFFYTLNFSGGNELQNLSHVYYNGNETHFMKLAYYKIYENDSL